MFLDVKSRQIPILSPLKAKIRWVFSVNLSSPSAALLGAFLGLSLLASPLRTASAQSAPNIGIGGEIPTEGIRLQYPSLIGDGGASGMEINPATMAFVRRWALAAAHSEQREGSRIGGRGTALYAVGGLPGGFLSSFRWGLSASYLRGLPLVRFNNAWKTTLSLGLKISRNLGLGVSFNRIYSSDDPFANNLASVDLGLSYRANRALALAYAVTNLSGATYGGFTLPIRHTVELGVRPLSKRHLEIAGGVRINTQSNFYDPFMRIGVEVARGFEFLAYADGVWRDFDGPQGTLENRFDLRLNVGARYRFPQVRISAGVMASSLIDDADPNSLIGQQPGSDAEFHGVQATIDLMGKSEPPIASASKMVVIKLKGHPTLYRQYRVSRAIRQGMRRSDLRGVILDMKNAQLSFGQAAKLHDHISRLQKAGKPVIAILGAPKLLTYVAVSSAKKIILDPSSYIGMTGIKSTRNYLSQLLTRIGIDPIFVKFAEYKSFPERLTREGPSPEAAENHQALIDTRWAWLERTLRESPRNSPQNTILAHVGHGPYTSTEAKKMGLVDGLLMPHELDRFFSARHINMVPEKGIFPDERGWGRLPHIAVVEFNGDIVQSATTSRIPGRDNPQVVEKHFLSAMDRLASDSNVRAILLRVDSPGGSARASHHIWKKLLEISKKKPLYTSVANLCASGCYFAAAPSKRIFAPAPSVVGSIGIFWGKLDISKLLQKIGITAHTMKKGDHATIASMQHGLSKEEEARVRAVMFESYQYFLTAVSSGRHIPRPALTKIAGGRVFAGSTALQNKLIDQSGTFLDALDAVAKDVGLSHMTWPAAYYLKQKKSLLSRLIGQQASAALRSLSPSATLSESLLASLLKAIPDSLLDRILGNFENSAYDVGSDGSYLMRLPWIEGSK